MVFLWIGVGLSGKLGFLWNKNTLISLLGYSSGHIDVFVSLSNFSSFCFTGFYGNLKLEIRKFSWDLLTCLSISSNLLWLVAEDSNEILSVTEKTGRERND